MHPTTILSLLLSTLVATATATEFQIITTHKVECKRKTKSGDELSMHYTGTLEDGKVFDSSVDRGPFKFQLGAGRVIQGWDKGLLDMCVGEKRKLIIPPAMGYGDNGIGPIPGGAVLIFETELLGIGGVSKDEL